MRCTRKRSLLDVNEHSECERNAEITFLGKCYSSIGLYLGTNALSLLGLLSRFVGMLTDSRSFLSYPRHEYFRRTLCNLIGNDVEAGLLPASELDFLGQMVENISYNNAKEYFKF